MKTHQAKITGLIEIGEPLNENSDYSIALEQCCIKRIDSKKLADDETERITYSLENLGRVNIITEKEKKPYLIKGKSKKCTKSQILRLKIEASGRDYENTMNTILERWEELL